MLSGIEIYDEATQKLVFGTSSRAAKIINRIVVRQGVDAAGDIPQLEQGYSPIWFVQSVTGRYQYYPNVRVEGRVLVVSWGEDATYAVENGEEADYYIIHYGYF